MTYFSLITIVHTLISLIAIAFGVDVMRRLFAGESDPDRNQAFLITAAATSVTGYFFPFAGVTPAQIVGLLALAILAVCWRARGHLSVSAFWRVVYAAGMAASLYLLVFVGVVQAFKHIGPLHALAPNGNEPPFAAAQGVVLALFVVIGFLVARRFRRAYDGSGVTLASSVSSGR